VRQQIPRFAVIAVLAILLLGTIEAPVTRAAAVVHVQAGVGAGIATVDPITLAPDAIDFGTVPTGSPATPRVVTLTNASASAVSVTSVTVGGTNASDLSVVSETCTTAPIATGGSCTVSVGFTPGAAGPRNGSVTISGPTPIDSRVVTVTGNGGPPPSAVAWGPTLKAGRAYTWNSGISLDRTVRSGAQKLHLVYATDRVGGAWSTNRSHRAGVYYVRSTSGSTWSTPKRLNPTTQTATRVALAAAGSRVYVAWVSQTRINGFQPTKPRVVYVRVNTNHGRRAAWRPTIRLTGTSTRADYPAVAASGTDAYVAWTRSDSGGIRIATSRNRGANWVQKTIGSTLAGDASGRAGMPVVAADGATVAVAWISDSGGNVRARVSTDRGKTWGTTVVVGSGAYGAPSIAIRGSRIAVSWATLSRVFVRQRIAGSWADPIVAADLTDMTDPIPYAPVVALQGTTRIAVSWSEAPQGTDGADLRWKESKDDGSTWYGAQTLAASASSAARRTNDWASIIWPTEGTRYIVWNGWTAETTNYRLYLRKGSGILP
jgi:hypothetical protein